MEKRKRKRRIAAVVAVLVLLPVFLVAAEVTLTGILGYSPVMAFMQFDLPFMGEDFSREKWLETKKCLPTTDPKCGDTDLGCPLGPMVRDLRNNHLIAGQTTRAQVEALLGPPDDTGTVGGEKGCTHYLVGMCSGFQMDYGSLYVCFDRSGVVTTTGHVQH